MSELANRLKTLRGQRTIRSVAKQAGISEHTIYHIERGGDTRLSTLRQILEALSLSPEEHAETLILWIKAELGPDFDQLDIRSRLTSGESPQTYGAGSVWSQLCRKAKDLHIDLQTELLKAMDRPELLRCIKHLNQAFDRMETRDTSRPVPTAKSSDQPPPRPSRIRAPQGDTDSPAKPHTA